MHLNGVNCYLGKEDDRFILFDTGGHLFFDKQFNDRGEALEKQLSAHGCDAENLKLVVLTHGDNDHAANAARIRKKYHTKIAMHPDDLEMVDCPTTEILLRNCRYRSLLYKLTFLAMNNFLKKIIIKTLGDFESFKPDIWVDDGFDLSPYGFDAKVVHLPGHTKGSIGILTADGDLIAGDTFANTDRPAIAPNAYDFETLRSSVEKLKTMKIKTVYPGHGSPFEADALAELRRRPSLC